MTRELRGFTAYRTSGKWIVFTHKGRYAFATRAKAELFLDHRFSPAMEDFTHGPGCYCHSLTVKLPRGY